MAGMKYYRPTTRGPHKGEDRFRVSRRSSDGKQISTTIYGRSNAKRFKKDIEDGLVNRDTGKYFDEERDETQQIVLDGLINTRNERTFGKLASRFIRVKKEEGYVSPATVEDYRQLLDIHIRPTLGDFLLDEIGLSQIEDMVMAIKSNDRKRNAGPRTINKCLVLTRSIFKYGIDLQWCTENPATRKRLIKYQKRDGKVMRPAETWRIIENIERPYDLAIKILAFTGCRRGEAIALKWSDINFEDAMLRFERSFKTRRFEIQPTKTKQSRRIVMDLELLKSLRIFAASTCAKIDPDSWLFPDPTGEFPVGGDVLLRRFKRAEKRSSLNGFVLHDFRHSFISHCAAAGIPPAVVQAYTGHANLSTLQDIYTHVQESGIRCAANTITEIFSKELPSQNLISDNSYKIFALRSEATLEEV